MSNPKALEVRVPFLKKKVPLLVDLDRHPALETIQSWGPAIKKKIEAACFANYKDKIASIGLNPRLPGIRKPSEVWKHLEIESIRIDARVDDAIVLHLVPDWDVDLQIELCIKDEQISYAGQFLLYPVDAYGQALG
jgi:hypothetical protein